MRAYPTTELELATNYNARWAYKLKSDMWYNVNGANLPNLEAWHGKQLLLTIYNGSIIVHRGYSFDGMTCYPDNPANLTAACLHDALYQTGATSRKTADLLLREIMRAQGQQDALLVYAGVRLFGWLAYRSNNDITFKNL